MILSIGVIVAAPLAVMFMNGNGDKPAPDPIVDPTDPNAYLMKPGENFEISTNQATNIKIPSDEKTIKFEGPMQNTEEYVYSFSWGVFSAFKNLNYLEFGHQWCQGTKEYDSYTNLAPFSGFQFMNNQFQNNNIDQIIFRETRITVDENHKFSYIFSIENYDGSGSLDGNKSYFFDVDLKSIKFDRSGNKSTVFSIDPESIYIREGSGTIDEWAEELNVTNKSIFKVIK